MLCELRNPRKVRESPVLSRAFWSSAPQATRPGPLPQLSYAKGMAATLRQGQSLHFSGYVVLALLWDLYSKLKPRAILMLHPSFMSSPATSRLIVQPEANFGGPKASIDFPNRKWWLHAEAILED